MNDATATKLGSLLMRFRPAPFAAALKLLLGVTALLGTTFLAVQGSEWLRLIAHGLHLTSGTYGAVFGVFFRQKLAGKPYTVVGDGTQRRDFIYVTDVAQAFLAAARTPISGERFNVGAGNPQSVNRLVELLGGDVVHVPKRPGEPDCTFANIAKIVSQLGWTPVVPFDEGVRRMLVDIERWRDAPLWDPDRIAEATKTWFQYLGKQSA